MYQLTLRVVKNSMTACKQKNISLFGASNNIENTFATLFLIIARRRFVIFICYAIKTTHTLYVNKIWGEKKNTRIMCDLNKSGRIEEMNWENQRLIYSDNWGICVKRNKLYVKHLIEKTLKQKWDWFGQRNCKIESSFIRKQITMSLLYIISFVAIVIQILSLTIAVGKSFRFWKRGFSLL